MFFFFNDTATTEIYTLSLHDALPIFGAADRLAGLVFGRDDVRRVDDVADGGEAFVLRDLRSDRLLVAEHEEAQRSEEHTSELQSRQYLVCRLLLEKKKKRQYTTYERL